jgi:hypothetical protein
MGEQTPAVYESEPWQSVETAPKDGTAILVWDKKLRRCFHVLWCGGDWAAYSESGFCEQPTHWMPMPESGRWVRVPPDA